MWRPPRKMKRVVRLYYVAMYYASWFWFGLVGLGLNLCCALLLPVPRTAALQRRVRAALRRSFDLWTRWFHACGVLRVSWKGLPPELAPGTVYVANHPSLLDATLLLSRMPEAFCIFKPALMRNPCIAPAAILGDYLSGGRDADTLLRAADKVAAGQSLLVFPEGTRTERGERLGAFKPGFTLIARRANAPIQTLVIRSSPGLVTRGRPWWVAPAQLPATWEVSLGRRWPAQEGACPRALAAEIEADLRGAVAGPVE